MGLKTARSRIGRTAATAATWASACFPVPMTAIVVASGRADQRVATPDIDAVRSWPRAKASITARSRPSPASHSSRSGVAPPPVWAQDLAPASDAPGATPPSACNVWPPFQATWVFSIVTASPAASRAR